MKSNLTERDDNFSLLSWNIAGRVRVLDEQLLFILLHKPNIIALQEVIRGTVLPIRNALEEAGYILITDSFDLAEDKNLLKGNRQHFVLIACIWPGISLDPSQFPIPWPERVVSAVINSPFGPVEIHNAHIPCGASNGWKKIETFEGIFQRLSSASKIPRILCGDFNTPQCELANGTVVSWGQSISKENVVSTKGKDERWHSGEWNVAAGLRNHDLPDVFRQLHGYERQEYSWYWRGKGKERGRRFDHIFASKVLRPVQCEYIHEAREKWLSDHSPIKAIFCPLANNRED